MKTTTKAKGLILLVEDNAKILDTNRRILEDEGYTVACSSTVQMTRSLLNLGVLPDAAVLDINLPDGDSFRDLFPDLRDKYNVPALFLTADVRHKTVNAVLRDGGFEYMTKPYNTETLCLRVSRMVEASRSMRRKEFAAKYGLSDAEMNIARLISEGEGIKIIANKVNLSESRVKGILTEMYNKLGITAPDSGNKRKLLEDMIETNGVRFDDGE